MRNLVIDFDLTVLWPLILFALVVLISSIRILLSANRDCKAAKKRLAGTFATKEEGEKVAELGRSRCEAKWKSKGCVWASAIVLVVSCAATQLPDSWIVTSAYWVWSALWLISVVLFVVAVGMAWHYAKKSDWLRLGVCLVAVFMAVASGEHFFHQRMNARHVTCPQCGNTDEQPEDF